MATHYYITWQPDCAEPGHYFLTHIESDNPNMGVGQIMDAAFEIEELDPSYGFEIGSILRVDGSSGPAVVLH